MVSSVKRWMPLVSLLTISIVTVTTLFVAHTQSPAQEFDPPSPTDDQPGSASAPAGNYSAPRTSDYVTDTPVGHATPDNLSPTNLGPTNLAPTNLGPTNLAPTSNGYGYASPGQTLPPTTQSSPAATAITPYFTPVQPHDFRPNQTAQAWSLPPSQGHPYASANGTPPALPSGYQPTDDRATNAPAATCTTCQVAGSTSQYANRQYANRQYADIGQFTSVNQIPSTTHATGDTWIRKIGPCSSTLSGVGGNLLRGELVGPEFRVVYTAEYSTTQDSVMYGVLQSVTIQRGADGQTFDLDELLEVEALSNKLIDQPFSARVRADGNQLILKDVKCAGIDLQDDNEIGAILKTVVVGSYTKQSAGPAPTVSVVPYPVYAAPVPHYQGQPAPQALIPTVPQY